MKCLKVPELETFTGTQNQDAKLWLLLFSNLSKIYDWSDNEKLLQLPFYLGDSALQWFYVNKVNDKTWHNAMKMFEQWFMPNQVEKISLREEFANLKQDNEESIEDYIQRVQVLASKISASEQDVFLTVIKGFGMHIRQYVFMKYPENMQELIDIAKIAQNIPKPLTFNEAAFRDSVNKCLNFEFNKLLDKQAFEGNKKAVYKKRKASGKCGTLHEDNNCLAANELCNYCQTLGHFLYSIVQRNDDER